MFKIIQSGAQDFSEPVVSLVKISSRGLIGTDRQDLIKRAGVDFIKQLDHVKFASGEVPVHMIAIGATEDYGSNRNGDGFRRDCCRNYHNTFVKHARFYRDHQNKNPAKSYGIVKASTYNEQMHRIELLCALNGSKEAAERNGGLLADKELEKLAKEELPGVSMACTIPFDVCSACGNKAKTRAEYCDAPENGGHCKAGGLKRNIGKVLADGHILHADNPNPKFFDISHVFRPADRIAYISGKLEKAASAATISGAELAEQWGVSGLTLLPDIGDMSKAARAQVDVLNLLVQAENLHTDDQWTKTALASSAQVQPTIDFTGQHSVKMAEVLRGLADAGIVLPLRDFLALTVKTADNNLVSCVAAALPNIFSKLANDPDIVDKLERNVYTPAPSASDAVSLWAEKMAATHSVLPHSVEKRAYLAVIRGVQPPALAMLKQASSTAGTALAEHYALYKIAALSVICAQHGNDLLTANHCVLQNYIM